MQGQPQEPSAARAPSGAAIQDAGRGFSEIRSAFEAAAGRRPADVREFPCVFAGREAHVRTVGRRLGEVAARALAHLAAAASPGRNAELRIDLWDGAETGVPWRMLSSPGGTGLDYWFAASADQRYVALERQGELTWLDRQAGHVVGWIPDALKLNLAEQARAAYFAVLLWMRDQGLHVMHAGLVARDGAGLLLAGESGQGKSTSALSCLLGGMDFLSDDHVWLERAGPAFVGHALYASVNVRPAHLRSFPSLAAHAIGGRVEEKSLVFLHPLFPSRIKPSVEIRAVVLPRIVRGEKSRFRPAVKADAAVAMVRGSLVEWSFKRMPSAAERFQCLAGLAEAVPCFHVELGQDLTDIPRCMTEILREVGGP
jgi:hypothetical protein